MPDEIVICDDKSTDDTVQIAKDILEKSNLEYKIEVNESNLGVIKNFEKAIVMCSGDIIFTSDQDDVWVETKVEEMVDVLEEDNDLLLVFSDAYLVDCNLNKMKSLLWQASCPKLYSEHRHICGINMLLKGNFVTGATMAFRRSLLKYAYPFTETWMHDYWLAFIASYKGKIEGINRPLIMYRQHNNNVLGAKKMLLFEKVSIYFRNLKTIEIIRDSFLARFIVLAEHYKRTEEIIDDKTYNSILKTIEFWSELVKLKNSNFVRGTKLIFNKYFCGEYNTYYTGIRGAARDVLYLLIKEC
jgi:glycosyltransferase involved in cell wall biosynthesis